METTIVKTVAGSRLFGAATPESDTDYKFVFLPNGKDILMQSVPNNIQKNSKQGSDRNSSEDVDCEGFSLQRFLSMAANGQTLAIEMLFTPPDLIIESSDIWVEIQNNTHRLVSKQIGPFVGYCRAQSSKYCLKAGRLNAASKAMDVFSQGCQSHGNSTKIFEILPILIELSKEEFIEVQYGNEKHSDNWFSCCGRKVPLTASLKRGLDLYSELVSEYGKRAKIAADSKSIDWKALYHSYRVACEANELLLTGRLTLPRPEAKILLKIRSGELSYQEVSDLIETMSNQVEDSLLQTELPEFADWNWINDFIFKHHLRSVEKSYKFSL